MTDLRSKLGAALAPLTQVPGDLDDIVEARQRTALLVLISLVIMPIALLWGALYLAFGAPVGYVPLVYFAILLGALLVFARTRDANFLLRVNLLDILFAPTISMIPLGGFLGSGGVGLWGILAPLGALVFSGVRAGIRWYAAFVVVFLVSGVAGAIAGNTSPLPEWFTSTMLGLNVTVGGTVIFTLMALFLKQRQEALSALRTAQERAESLLLNILPASVAERLKHEPQTIADQFSAASILFADVVDFTPRTQEMRPAEVVGLLDQLFSRFDALADKYGVEKIKTIGDCYMVAAGVPTARADHARALALLALDMVHVTRSTDALGHLDLELRIGINSGPVVAGVIGQKRFLYDLWGDAVNIASRMESHGVAGRIQITRATYDLIDDEFECEPRGMVSIKGKGDMPTWYLNGPRRQRGESSMRADDTRPVASAASRDS